MYRTCLFVLVLMLCAAASSRADEPELPPLSQPGQWNYVTQDDAASSSHCIGRPRTPLCAVETLLGCFQRGRIELCRMVDDGADQYAQVFASPVDPGLYLAYRIVGGQALTPDTLPAGQSAAQPGDVLLVLDQREGALGRYAHATGAPASNFLLRKQADGAWKIINWGDPED